MMFVCYSLALAILGVAYHWPDLVWLAALFVVSRLAQKLF